MIEYAKLRATWTLVIVLGTVSFATFDWLGYWNMLLSVPVGVLVWHVVYRLVDLRRKTKDQEK